MIFEWKQYLNIAKYCFTCKNTKDREGYLRTAISRAYYGFFCYARNYAIAYEGYKSSDSAGDHHDLPIHFISKQDDEHRYIGSDLQRLHKRRSSVDYDDIYNKKYETNLEVSAEYCVETAEKDINQIDEFIKSLPS